MNSASSPIRSSLAGWQPRSLFRRVNTSLNNPRLIGEASQSDRYRKIQWCMNLWRFLVTGEILVLILLDPDRSGSIPDAVLIFLLLLFYTIAYSYLSTRTHLAGMTGLHAADLIFCAALFYLGLRTGLGNNLVFYSFASLLSQPSTRLRDNLPGMAFLSLAYLGSEALRSYDASAPPDIAISFLLFYIWGFGFLGFSNIVSRVSALQLDARLEEQRRDYRRRLHDDLGNTLCGLHFKIESLTGLSRGAIRENGLGFLSAGYRRADAVLKRLLSDLEEPEDTLEEALSRLKNSIEKAGGPQVEIDTHEVLVDISSEVQYEVMRIIGEVATNAMKHARASRILIRVGSDRRRLTFSVTDDGRGFDVRAVEQRRASDSFGIVGIRERAALINGNLGIDSRPGRGTTVHLEVPAHRQQSLLGRILDFDSTSVGGGLFPFLIRIKGFVFLLAVISFITMPPEQRLSTTALVAGGLLLVNNLAIIVWSKKLFGILTRWPWLIALQQIFYGSLFFICWHNGLPLFFQESVSVDIIISAYFLGIARNTLMAMFLGSLILLANFLAPAAAQLHSLRVEDLLYNVDSNLIFALTAGLAVEFIRNMEAMQQRAISRALTRQRERLTAITHRELGDLVGGLGNEVSRLGLRLDDSEAAGAGDISELELKSTHLKHKLRTILNSLEEAGKESGLPEPM
ncbi:MAG: ATP-binding protein [Actinobacteria bacterium]|nr:ATP-binding protein [Actinomycetota bacterium]MCL5882608.1 ATP-binding protein [Actinomycetota bacterium]